MFASVYSCLPYGLEGRLIQVQADAAPGSVEFAISGLGAASVKEARHRVKSAIRNSGLEFPKQRLTVNLAPAELRKQGTALDLPIAVAVAMAAIGKQVPGRIALVGELSLDGTVGHVDGVLVAARSLATMGFRELFVPAADVAEAALASGLAVFGCSTLAEAVNHLLGLEPLHPEPPRELPRRAASEPVDDLAEVQGQEAARRALEVAAAGGHHLLLSGPPGAGKTMLARCLPGILPPMDLTEALEVAQVRSVLGEIEPARPLVWERPFRSPHHGVSTAGLIGGGSGVPRPGEVSRAHNGVLFLDELGEFVPAALQAMRQPLEDGRVSLTRAGGSIAYPARFQLVGATNPCPCGWLGDSERACRCTEAALASYRRALSGPLLDRIDLRVTVSRPRLEALGSGPPGEPSSSVRERVLAARARQLERQGRLNALLKPSELRSVAPLEPAARLALQRWGARQGLTARAFHRAWRVALTLADLEAVSGPAEAHVMESLGYRLGDEVA